MHTAHLLLLSLTHAIDPPRALLQTRGVDYRTIDPPKTGNCHKRFLELQPAILQPTTGCFFYPGFTDDGRIASGLQGDGYDRKLCQDPGRGVTYARNYTISTSSRYWEPITEEIIFYSWYSPIDNTVEPEFTHAHDWQNVAVWVQGWGADTRIRAICLSQNSNTKPVKYKCPPTSSIKLYDDKTGAETVDRPYFLYEHENANPYKQRGIQLLSVASDLRIDNKTAITAQDVPPCIMWETLTPAARDMLNDDNYRFEIVPFSDSNIAASAAEVMNTVLNGGSAYTSW